MKPFPGFGGRYERGVTMLEVLITIVIVVMGLLGLAGLQARIQAAELEAYQRTQAMVLLQDMVDRLTTNRKQALNYVTTGVGTGTAAADCVPMTGYQKDLCEWSNALLGAAETLSDGTTKVGAMIGARGCVANTVASAPREFLISVTWQGLTPTAAPPAALTCGQGQYGNEALRRVVTARVVIACLQSDPATGLCAP